MTNTVRELVLRQFRLACLTKDIVTQANVCLGACLLSCPRPRGRPSKVGTRTPPEYVCL
eukprot:m.167641 g.167641  ORF g.167641 m.167641 type:complete len:59 (-) comp17773_c1_seq1:437-613(-)